MEENKKASIEKSYNETKKELVLEGNENPTQEEIYERAEKINDLKSEVEQGANDSANKANNQKRKRAAAWYMGTANVLVVDENDEGHVEEFANKDIAEEWVQENLKAGECAEISVVYKRFKSKEVVRNEIVED